MQLAPVTLCTLWMKRANIIIRRRNDRFGLNKPLGFWIIKRDIGAAAQKESGPAGANGARAQTGNPKRRQG